MILTEIDLRHPGCATMLTWLPSIAARRLTIKDQWRYGQMVVETQLEVHLGADVSPVAVLEAEPPRHWRC